MSQKVVCCDYMCVLVNQSSMTSNGDEWKLKKKNYYYFILYYVHALIHKKSPDSYKASVHRC